MGSSRSNIPAEMGSATLSGGSAKIPLLGFGTAVFPFHGSETMRDSILHAIKLGYRHFDAAAIYQSEERLGEAIAQALQLGLINSRDDLFITSKLWCRDGYHDSVLPALQKTLRNIGLEYLDLYLIHFGVSVTPDATLEAWDPKFIVPMDIKAVWKAMEDCQNLGLTKNIGVSNFTCKKLQDLLSLSNIPPAVNQVEMNPLWQQKKLRDFCEEKGIHVSAYSPLGAKGTFWGTNKVMDCEVLKEIALTKGKTIAQVCLRWVYEQGVSVLVKSFNKERIKENLDIFDWSLTTEERNKISQIPQERGNLAILFVSEHGPFKSLEELWDGEM